MTDHREVMRQALNALIWEVGSEPAMYSAQTRAAIKALRAAIDEPVPEPVAWLYSVGAQKAVSMDYVPGVRAQPLYARPPAPPAAEPLMWECKVGGLKPLSQRLYESQPDAIKRHYTRIAPPAADVDAITVRLTREQHSELQWLTDEFGADMRDELLAILGTFPDAAGKGKP